MREKDTIKQTKHIQEQNYAQTKVEMHRSFLLVIATSKKTRHRGLQSSHHPNTKKPKSNRKRSLGLLSTKGRCDKTFNIANSHIAKEGQVNLKESICNLPNGMTKVHIHIAVQRRQTDT